LLVEATKWEKLWKTLRKKRSEFPTASTTGCKSEEQKSEKRKPFFFGTLDIHIAVDRAARFQSSIAVPINLQNTLPPLRPNVLGVPVNGGASLPSHWCKTGGTSRHA